jgi:hypothetical protein
LLSAGDGALRTVPFSKTKLIKFWNGRREQEGGLTIIGPLQHIVCCCVAHEAELSTAMTEFIFARAKGFREMHRRRKVELFIRLYFGLRDAISNLHRFLLRCSSVYMEYQQVLWPSNFCSCGFGSAFQTIEFRVVAGKEQLHHCRLLQLL